MYALLLTLHSAIRWLVVITLITSIWRAAIGLKNTKVFSRFDNSLRHWTATIAHIQLTIGVVLYFKSPIVNFFLKGLQANFHSEARFFGLIHILMMIVAVIVLTIGSGLSKRQLTPQAKYKTMLLWYSIALLSIIIAIPWPFSPLASRPYIRIF